MLEATDIERLNAPFPLSAHKIMRGFAYLQEQDITRRLDVIDPSWSFVVISVEQRNDTVYAHGRLTIKGISRDGVGMEKIQVGKNGSEVNEAEKSAATDSLKRAARLFGMGRYLLDAGNIRDTKDLSAYLSSISSAKPPSNVIAPEFDNQGNHKQSPLKSAEKAPEGEKQATQPAQPDNAWAQNRDTVKAFGERMKKALNIPGEYVLAALRQIEPNMGMMNEWTRTQDKAEAAVIAWYHGYSMPAVKSWLDENPQYARLNTELEAVCNHQPFRNWTDANVYEHLAGDVKASFNAFQHFQNSITKHHDKKAVATRRKMGMRYFMDFLYEHYPREEDAPVALPTPSELVRNETFGIHRVEYDPTSNANECWKGWVKDADGVQFDITIWPEDRKTMLASGYRVSAWDQHKSNPVPPTEEIPVMIRKSKKKGVQWEITHVMDLAGEWIATPRIKNEEKQQ